MDIIKLNATPSTNDFLKNLCNTQSVENFTIVVAENQTRGKGQRGNIWEAEFGKSLTFSILIRKNTSFENSVFDLNVAISVSIIQALEGYDIPKLNIKWPNDILSEGKKIAGILIENTISGQQSVLSIIGIGLNVNQTDFAKLPKASSLKNRTQKEFDKGEIMLEIIRKIKENHELISQNKADILWEKYHNYLFRKETPSVFEYPNGEKFMGIIKQVLKNGKIRILLEDDSVKEFDLKEVGLVY